MLDIKWEPGMEVIVVPSSFCVVGFGPGAYLSTIKRVMARFIELADGTKWDHWGYRYPRRHDRFAAAARLRPATSESLAEFRYGRAYEELMRLLGDVYHQRLPKPSFETCQAVIAAFRAQYKPVPSEPTAAAPDSETE